MFISIYRYTLPLKLHYVPGTHCPKNRQCPCSSVKPRLSQLALVLSQAILFTPPTNGQTHPGVTLKESIVQLS